MDDGSHSRGTSRPNTTTVVTQLDQMRVRHLERAYERDLPITLTSFAEPQLLGRLPVRSSELLPYMHAQQRAARLQQRRQHHYDDEDEGEGEGNADADADVDVDVDDDAAAEALLPDGVWKILSEVATSELLTVPVSTTEEVSALASGVAAADEEMVAASDTTTTAARRGDPSLVNSRNYHRAARTAALAWASREEQKVLHYLFPEDAPEGTAAAAAAAGSNSSSGALFYGARAVGPHSSEYVATLTAWQQRLRETAAAAGPTASQARAIAGLLATAQTAVTRPVVKTTPADVLSGLVPPRLLIFFDVDRDAVARHARRRREQLRAVHELERELADLIAGAVNVQHDDDGGDDGSSSSGGGGGEGGKGQATSNNQTKLVERKLQSAYEEFLAGGADGGRDPVVGDVLLILEEPNAQQATRPELLQLELKLDQYLRCSHARCYGHPLHSGAYRSFVEGLLARQQQQQQRERERDDGAAMMATGTQTIGADGTAPRSLGATLVGRRKLAALTPAPPPPRTKNGIGRPTTPTAASLKAAAAELSGGAAAATAAAGPPLGTRAADGTVGAGDAKKSTNGGARKKAARHAEDCGGTTSVVAALDGLHPELNHERHVLQFHLLGQELLRQVTLDLPERGVLLSRLLDEASLSVESYDVLVRTAAMAALQHKTLEGAEERDSAARARLAQLEAEVAAVNARRETLLARQDALRGWTRERRLADEDRLKQLKAFHVAACERIRKRTEEVTAQQDRERRGSNGGA